MRKIMTDEVKAEVIRLYRDGGLGGPQIARQFGFRDGGSVVYRTLHEAGIFPRALAESGEKLLSNGGQRRFRPEEEAEIAASYRQGFSIPNLIERYQCDWTTIIGALKRQSTPIQRRGKRAHKFTGEQVSDILTRWKNGQSSTSIARLYKVQRTTIGRLLIVNGEGSRPPGVIRGLPEDKVQAILKMWNGGESQVTISKAFDISQSSVRRTLLLFNVKLETRRARGESHGLWKGGRVLIEGYTHVLISPDHAFWSMANTMGYAAEHRLIMAQKLKRPLTRSETVHHIDGNPLNNDIENLQLRLGRHGKGVVYHCADCGSTNIIASPLAKKAEISHEL